MYMFIPLFMIVLVVGRSVVWSRDRARRVHARRRLRGAARGLRARDDLRGRTRRRTLVGPRSTRPQVTVTRSG